MKPQKRYAIHAMHEIDAQVSREELAYALFRVVFDLLGEEIDDAGCDWYTDGQRIYLGDWIIAENEPAARLVDAANVLHYGHTISRVTLTLSP